MKRVQGLEGTALIECINPRYNKYRVRWDLQPLIDEETGFEGVTFLETELLHRPTLQEIKDIVLAWMNGQIEAQILGGFVWNDMQIWLSSENQFNYKAAYDLAVQTGGASLPVVFKLGTNDAPVYHTFTSVDEFRAFYMAAINHISTTLNEGWARKDAIDWTPYEEALLTTTA